MSWHCKIRGSCSGVACLQVIATYGYLCPCWQGAAYPQVAKFREQCHVSWSEHCSAAWRKALGFSIISISSRAVWNKLGPAHSRSGLPPCPQYLHSSLLLVLGKNMFYTSKVHKANQKQASNYYLSLEKIARNTLHTVSSYCHQRL